VRPGSFRRPAPLGGPHSGRSGSTRFPARFTHRPAPRTQDLRTRPTSQLPLSSQFFHSSFFLHRGRTSSATLMPYFAKNWLRFMIVPFSTNITSSRWVVEHMGPCGIRQNRITIVAATTRRLPACRRRARRGLASALMRPSLPSVRDATRGAARRRCHSGKNLGRVPLFPPTCRPYRRRNRDARRGPVGP